MAFTCRREAARITRKAERAPAAIASWLKAMSIASCAHVSGEHLQLIHTSFPAGIVAATQLPRAMGAPYASSAAQIACLLPSLPGPGPCPLPAASLSQHQRLSAELTRAAIQLSHAAGRLRASSAGQKARWPPQLPGSEPLSSPAALPNLLITSIFIRLPQAAVQLPRAAGPAHHQAGCHCCLAQCQVHCQLHIVASFSADLTYF